MYQSSGEVGKTQIIPMNLWSDLNRSSFRLGTQSGDLLRDRQLRTGTSVRVNDCGWFEILPNRRARGFQSLLAIAISRKGGMAMPQRAQACAPAGITTSEILPR